MDEQFKELQDGFKKTVDDGLAPIKEKIGEIEQKVDTLEKAPAKMEKVRDVDGSSYHGRNLNKMARMLKEKCVDNRSFDAFSSEEKVDEYSKFIADFVDARVRNNPEAMQRMFARQKASYQEGTPSEGGYLVPDEFQWDIIKLGREKYFALNECRVVNMNTDQLYLPTEATLATTEWDSEEGQIGQKEGTLGQVSLSTKRLNSLAIASNELLQDSAIDVVSLITEQFSYAILGELDNQVVAGTGDPVSGLMKGVAGTSVVLGTGSANFSMLLGDNFSNAISQLDASYLDGAKWIMGKTAKHYVRTMKDDNGAYLFQMPYGGQPATLWEYPIIESSKAPANAASTVATVFGNLKNFVIGRRLGTMSLDIDPYGKFDYYQTRFRMVTRWAFAMGNSSAFVSIVTAS